MATGHANPGTTLFSLIVQELIRAASLIDLETYNKFETACQRLRNDLITPGTLIFAQDHSISDAPFKVVRWAINGVSSNYELIDPAEVTVEDWVVTHNHPFPYYASLHQSYVVYYSVGYNYQLYLPMLVDSTLENTLNNKTFNEVLASKNILNIVNTKGKEFKQYYTCNFPAIIEPNQYQSSSVFTKTMPFPWNVPDAVREARSERYYLEVRQYDGTWKTTDDISISDNKVYFQSTMADDPTEQSMLLEPLIQNTTFMLRDGSTIGGVYDIDEDGNFSVSSRYSMTLGPNSIALYTGWISPDGEEYRSAGILYDAIDTQDSKERSLNYNPGDAKVSYSRQ